MRVLPVLFVLSLFMFLLFPCASFGDKPENCRSYVKTPDWIICLSSGNGEEDGKTIPKNEGGVPLADPTESVLDDLENLPASVFFTKDENGEITDRPRVFNDFSETEK